MSTPVTSLVVGGTSGIGLAAARQLAARGSSVHVGGRDADRVAAAVAADPDLQAHRVDGADPAAVAELTASIAPVDALVVTLGGSEGIGPLDALDLATLRRAFDAKFWATLTTVQATLPHLAADASITLVGAITAHAGMPGTAGIGALNAAVEALVRPLAVELAPRRVNAVSPGVVDTPWWAGMPDEQRSAYFEAAAAALPARRVATADDIAEAIVFLATNANVTGTVLESDAGARLVTL